MNTAVVGLGSIGSCVARHLSRSGVDIVVADRTLAKAEALAGELGGATVALSVEEAVGRTEVLILAVPFDAMAALLTRYRGVLAGRVVVDPSNPIEPDGTGGFRKTIPQAQSSGQVIADLLPTEARLVKAFGTLGAASLAAGANREPERAALFYATDHQEAGRTVARLITASGFAPVYAGRIDQSLRLEVGGDLHEFGKLGRLVSAREAEALV